MRREGFTGSLTIVGDEPHEPYDRPPLSKVALTDWVPPEHTGLPRLADLGDVDWRLGVAAAALDRHAQEVVLADGTRLPYDRVLIATGAATAHCTVNSGRVDIARLRRALAGLPLPAWDDGKIRLAADVSNWLRPDAATSPGRLFCHCYARGKGNAQMIPGWPYSLVAALEPGRTSWTPELELVQDLRGRLQQRSRFGRLDRGIGTGGRPRLRAGSWLVHARRQRPAG